MPDADRRRGADGRSARSPSAPQAPSTSGGGWPAQAYTRRRSRGLYVAATTVANSPPSWRSSTAPAVCTRVARGQARLEVRAQREAHERRVRQRLATVTGDVADDHRQLPVLEREHVVEVTAGARARRPAGRRPRCRPGRAGRAAPAAARPAAGRRPRAAARAGAPGGGCAARRSRERTASASASASRAAISRRTGDRHDVDDAW